MVKYLLIYCMMSFLNSCGQKLYKIEKDQYGEPLLNDKAQYSFTEKPTAEDLKRIDTTSYYVQKFPEGFDREDIRKNPGIIIFHNDGYFKNESLIYFGKFDEHRKKNSIYYGGKYRIKEDGIHLEWFGKSPDSKKWYTKYIKIGKIEGNRIIFKDKNSVTIFEKRKELPK